jgi:hypothetical protein
MDNVQILIVTGKQGIQIVPESSIISTFITTFKNLSICRFGS